MLSIGWKSNSIGDGYEIDIPEEYDILWLRIFNFPCASCIVYYRDHQNEIIGEFAFA